MGTIKATTAGDVGTAARRPRADAQRNAARLVEAAREVFTEQGADAPLEEIARRAGVGIGTLYRHFPNRDLLVIAAIKNTIDDSCIHAASLLDAEDAGEAFASWLRAEMHKSSACRGLAAEAMIMMLDDENGAPACAPLRDLGAQLLERAQAAGAVRAGTDFDDLLRLVNAISMATEDAPDREAQADRLFTLMMNGLKA
jgi:AcrR family transcriptional regulator